MERMGSPLYLVWDDKRHVWALADRKYLLKVGGVQAASILPAAPHDLPDCSVTVSCTLCMAELAVTAITCQGTWQCPFMGRPLRCICHFPPRQWLNLFVARYMCVRVQPAVSGPPQQSRSQLLVYISIWRQHLGSV
jgi:hypothetical protein